VAGVERVSVRRTVAAVVLVLASALVACTRVPAPPPRSEPAGADATHLEAMLDRLEERLLASRAKVALWAELRERHGEVAEVACRNLGEHARAIAMFNGRQRDKRAALRKNRVATRFDPASVDRR
jgi:hypothetical protein